LRTTDWEIPAKRDIARALYQESPTHPVFVNFVVNTGDKVQVSSLAVQGLGQVFTLSNEMANGKRFQFEVIFAEDQGIKVKREQKDAFYETEDLGNGVTLEMVFIPAGTFMMGSSASEQDRSSNEGPQHQVTIEEGFYMGKYPVTQAQYEAVMGNNPSHRKGKHRPVENVSWDEAVAFCKKLSERTGKTYRLPSEAEWEYSCRAGTTTPYYFGEVIKSQWANCRSENQYEYEQRTEVGCFPPNAFGLYDMHGNVWEWCADPYYDNYEGAPSDGSVWNEAMPHSLRN